jgi:hypothetical protein
MINCSRPGCPRVMSWLSSFFDPLPVSCCFGSGLYVFLCVFLVCWEEYCQACYSSGYRFQPVPNHHSPNMPVYVSWCLRDFHQGRGIPLRWVQQDCDVSDLYSSCFLYPRMRSGIECLKRNRKNSHQQPPQGSLGKTGRAKAGVNISLSQ